MKKMKSNLTISILFASLFCINSGYSQDDQDDEDVESLDKIVVTGSRISRSDLEGPSPVTVISAEDILRDGYTNAFEALTSLTQFNGSNQDDQFAGGFTQAANSLDLRGLGPNRVLILLDGHRLSDYPLPFNGQSNITNLANIPSVLIERIEIVAAGSSAIYGSDAISGVINFILKKEIEGTTVSLRYGDTSDGGGQSTRLQVSGGSNNDKLTMTYGFEYFNRKPIYAFERDFQDSFADNPDNSGIPLIDDPENGVTNSRTFLILDPFDQNGDGFSYIDPGANACGPLSGLVNNTVDYSFRAGRGYYCGTPNSVSQRTIRNAKKSYSFVSNVKYEVNEDQELFALLNYVNTETRYDTGSTFWQYDLSGPIGGGFFVNGSAPDVFGIGGRVELWQRIFSHEEMGGYGANDQIYDEQSIDLVIGTRGTLNDKFDYEASYTHSQYDTKRNRRLIIGDVAQNFFLGQSTGVTDFGFGEFEIFNVDPARLYTPLTPQEYQSITGIDKTTADSSSDALQFVLSGDLFEMQNGYVGFASVLEYATQDYQIDLDPQLLDGTFFGFTGSGGGGDRDRYAVGVEFDFPLLETLNMSAAGRYDKYDDITNVGGAFTYNLGLQWRPTNNFLLRVAASSSFRAPDMHFVFADPSGFFTSVTDEYLCRRDEPDVTLPNCTNSGVGISGNRQGNPGLEEEESDSFGAGFVWEINDNMSMSIDYYNIDISNGVRDLSIAGLLTDEADCRLGQTEGGVPVDINSPTCVDAFSRITRLPILPGNPQSEAITNIVTGPINAAKLSTDGIDATFRYLLNSEKYGLFSFSGQYNLVLNSESQQFPDDPVNNDRDDLQNFDFRSTFKGTLAWNYNKWTSTLVARRTGTTPNWAETGRCCSQVIYNGSVQYAVNNDMNIGLFVQNIRNTRPPVDPTFNSYPYYSTFQFNPYGREVFLQLDYTFGR